MSNLLKVLAVRMAKTTYPTGNPNFSVKQAFPSGFDEVEADPFLMCDRFGPVKSNGPSNNPDQFEVGWHPHRGMDICTYMKNGIGRHADSLGNRESYNTPGMQWISVGSGIEHAEAFETPAGELTSGFQLWINVPAKHKLDDPQYGTIEPKDFPLIVHDQVEVRLLAGNYYGQVGPFKTKQKLEMLDYMLQPNAEITHNVPIDFDNCLLYVYEGSGKINNQNMVTHNVIRLDAMSAKDPESRNILLQAGPEGMSAMLFAGKRINEPIAWRGPFVMNTQEEIRQTLIDYQAGRFPTKRVAWDFTRLSSFPKEKQDSILEASIKVRENHNKIDISNGRTDCL